MFYDEDFEDLGMGNPWKKWKEGLGFRKLESPKPDREPQGKETESAPLLNQPSETRTHPSVQEDLISGPVEEPLINPDSPRTLPPRPPQQRGNPFETYSEISPAAATPPPQQVMQTPTRAQNPYYTVRVQTQGGKPPQIQLPPVPGPYGYGPQYGHPGYAPGQLPPSHPAPGGEIEEIGGDGGDKGGGKGIKGRNSADAETPAPVAPPPEQREEKKVDTPFFVTMLYAVTILVLFIHLPLGIMIGDYMRSISMILMVGPVGGILGLLSVYITPCECVSTREQAVARIRFMTMTGIILDLVGAIVMPLSLYSMECPGRDGEPYNNSCQFIRIPAQGVGMAAALCVGIHLFLMFVVRGSADRLAKMMKEIKDDDEEVPVAETESESESDDDSEDDDSDDDVEAQKKKKKKNNKKKAKDKKKDKKKKGKR